MLPRAVAVLLSAMSMPVCEQQLLTVEHVTWASDRNSSFSSRGTQQMLLLTLPVPWARWPSLHHRRFLVYAAYCGNAGFVMSYRWSTWGTFFQVCLTWKTVSCCMNVWYTLHLSISLISLLIAVCIPVSQYTVFCIAQSRVLLSLLLWDGCASELCTPQWRCSSRNITFCFPSCFISHALRSRNKSER